MLPALPLRTGAARSGLPCPAHKCSPTPPRPLPASRPAVWALHEQVAVAALDVGHATLAQQLVHSVHRRFPDSARASRLTVRRGPLLQPLPPVFGLAAAAGAGVAARPARSGCTCAAARAASGSSQGVASPLPPCLPAWLLPQGLVFEASGEWAQAEALYSKELERDPQNLIILKRRVRRGRRRRGAAL